MYVYQILELGLWDVGFYTPDGEWVSESDHTDRDEAAKRVAWLNGGSLPEHITQALNEGDGSYRP